MMTNSIRTKRSTLTRKTRIRRWSVHAKLSSRIRTQPTTLDRLIRTPFVPDLQHICRFRKGRLTRYLLPLPWVPYYLCRIPGNDVLGSSGWTYGIGVSVCRAGGDDCEGCWSNAGVSEVRVERFSQDETWINQREGKVTTKYRM